MPLDSLNMKKVIADSPQQLRDGLALGAKVALKGNFKNIVICGMGGSALPADVLATVAPPSIPMTIHRDYGLPAAATKESLVICVSYSGNTEETLSAMEEALEKKLTVVALSSGGKMEPLAQEHQLPFVKIPSGIQPRCATGYFFAALAKILSVHGLVANIDKEITALADDLTKKNSELAASGEELAKKIGKAIPIIYSTEHLKVVAEIWKIKFNENAKMPAFYNTFPELNHNEMVGFSHLPDEKQFHFILIRDEHEHERNRKRMLLFAELMQKQKAVVSLVRADNGSTLEKVFTLLLLGDWVSYYAALENNVDPSPVAIVEEFKGLMQS